MCSEEAKKLYDGKFFYEIVKSDDHLKLFGPMDTIRYVSPAGHTKKALDGSGPIDVKYKFVQVIDGQITAFFQENEILITDKAL